MKKIFISLLMLLGFTSIANANDVIKVGTMPAADSILLYVAQEEKLFQKQGLSVEIVPFQSAIEMGAAMRSGSIDGIFTCVINATLQHVSGNPQTIIATTSYARPNQRHFGLVVSPKKEINNIEDIQGKKVAIGKDTIVDYLLTQFLESRNLSDDYVEREDIRSIAMRLQLLMAGQLDMALLPEPLVSTLEARGAKVILDDTNLRMPLAVISFSQKKLTKENYNAIRLALDEASNLVNASPEKYKQMMVEKKLLSSDALSFYKMISFDKENTPLYIPNEEEIKSYFSWLKKRNLIKEEPDYKLIIPQFN